MYLIFHYGTIYNSLDIEATQVSIDGWVEKVDVYLVPFVTKWMTLQGIILSEISQMKKDVYHMISLICGIKQIKTKTMWNKSDEERHVPYDFTHMWNKTNKNQR